VEERQRFQTHCARSWRNEAIQIVSCSRLCFSFVEDSTNDTDAANRINEILEGYTTGSPFSIDLAFAVRLGSVSVFSHSSSPGFSLLSRLCVKPTLSKRCQSLAGLLLNGSVHLPNRTRSSFTASHATMLSWIYSLLPSPSSPFLLSTSTSLGTLTNYNRVIESIRHKQLEGLSITTIK